MPLFHLLGSEVRVKQRAVDMPKQSRPMCGSAHYWPVVVWALVSPESSQHHVQSPSGRQVFHVVPCPTPPQQAHTSFSLFFLLAWDSWEKFQCFGVQCFNSVILRLGGHPHLLEHFHQASYGFMFYQCTPHEE